MTEKNVKYFGEDGQPVCQALTQCLIQWEVQGLELHCADGSETRRIHIRNGIKRILRSGHKLAYGQKHHYPTTSTPLHSKLPVLPAVDPRLLQLYIPPGHLHLEVCHPAEHGSQWSASSLQTFTTVSPLLTEPSISSRCRFMQFQCTVLKCLVFCCAMSWQQPMWCSLVWASHV